MGVYAKIIIDFNLVSINKVLIETTKLEARIKT